MNNQEFDPFFYRYGLRKSTSQEQEHISKWDWQCYLFFTETRVGRFIFNGLKSLLIALTRFLEYILRKLA